MARLEFLGWVLEGTQDGPREYFPAPASGMWGPQVLFMKQNGGRRYLDTTGHVALGFTLDNLEFEIEFDPEGAELEQMPSGNFRLKRAENTVFIRMGKPPHSANRHWFAIGPARRGDASWPAYGFGADGEVVIPLSTARYLVTERADSSGSENPLAVQLGPGTMTLNLKKRTTELSGQALTARLRNARPGTGNANRMTEFFSTPMSRSFKSLASFERMGVAFLRPTGVATPVFLNVQRSGAVPAAGLEVLHCDMRLSFEKEKEGVGNVRVTEAELVPASGRTIVLRMMGAWNSRNQAEEWSCTGAVPLAFRIGRSKASGTGADVWSTAVLRPHKNPLPGLKRTNGRLPGRPDPLPMHGAIPGARFYLNEGRPTDLVRTPEASDKDEPLASVEWRVAELMCAQSRPWLRLSRAELHYPRPGDAYGDLPAWKFEAPSGKVSAGVPAIPLAHWRDGVPARVKVGNGEIDAAFGACVLNRMAGVHETGLVDASDNNGKPLPKIVSLMPREAGAETMQTLVLARHAKTLQLAAPLKAVGAATVPRAAISVSIDTPALEAGFEYSVCWEGAKLSSTIASFALTGWVEQFMTKLDMAVPVKVGLLRNDASRPNMLPFGIVKLGRQRGLGEILRALVPYAPSKFALLTGPAVEKVIRLIGETDSEVLAPAWVGMVAFSVPLDFSEFTALEQTIPLGEASSPRLDFLALGSSRVDTGANAGNGALSAAVSWTSSYDPTAQPPMYGKPENEVSLWPVLLDMRFKQGQMTAFKAALQLEFRSFFGMGNPVKAVTGPVLRNRSIQIIGSAQKTDPTSPTSPVEFRFAANTREPMQIYPISAAAPAADQESFIEGVWFKSLELVDTVLASGTRQSQIRIDGDIELRRPRNFSLAGEFLSKIQGRISFLNLGINLPGLPQLDPRLLKISYPSLSFNLDLPHVELFGNAMRMKLHQLALNWDGGFDFPGMTSLGIGSGKWKPNLPNVVFVGRVDFGNLPALFARGLSSFSLELGLGINFDPDSASLGLGTEFFVRGFGFEGLDFDLLQFLRVKIDRLDLGALPPNPAGATGARLSLGGASVEVLRYRIFKDASGGFFSRARGAGDGFWAYFPENKDGKFLLFFDWGFVAKNVDFSTAVPKTLLIPPPLQEVSDKATEVVETGRTLEKLWASGGIAPATDSAGSGWTFAAGLTVLGGTLRGRALIQDSGFAGLSLWGPELKKWFGYDFSFCGIYRRNITPGDDYFYISTTLPAVTLGTVHFTGGVVALEIYTSGDFMVDFGFPWPGVSGGREWRRTVGAIVTPGQASAGFYLRKREIVLQESDGGGKLLTITAGFAVQWGLGAAFGSGVFRAWVRIGLYAVMEGAADLRIRGSRLDLTGLVVAGAGGVLVEGEGAINWWVISVRVYVCASAEVSLVLTWQENQKSVLALRAELYVSASAEACVGGGWFKVCRSISVGLSIPVTHKLEF